LTVTNTGTSVLPGWTVTWTFANGQTVSNMWGGTPTQSGANVSVRNVAWTGNVAPNASVAVGFTGSSGATNAVPTVTCARA
jgi:hypothetical protein